MHLEQIHAHQGFRTDEFKQSGWIRSVCDKVGRVYRTDERLTEGHFGPFFGCLVSSKAKNPWRADLVWLHDLVHVLTLEHDPRVSWYDWSLMAARSELAATFASEVEAFIRIPDLRARLDDRVLWIDRHRFEIDDWTSSGCEGAQLEKNVSGLKQAFAEAVRNPDPSDFIERRHHAFSAVAFLELCVAWAKPVGFGPRADDPAFRVVVEHMATKPSLKKHRVWLEGQIPPNGTWQPGGPFSCQARATLDVYRAARERWNTNLLAL